MSAKKTDRIPSNLFDILRYDPKSGKFSWKIHTHGYAGMINPGDVAGTRTKSKNRYIMIGINGTLYRAHRLAWYIMTGVWLRSSQDIDHVNGRQSDNRWKNLRLATRSENMLNMTKCLRSDNKSGCHGVSFRRDTMKWHARIAIRGQIILLGNYDELSQAVAARKRAERRLRAEGHSLKGD
jgi:HNH endonuclease